MLLAPYRVLDLTHTHGMLCAQILGDLGADVIQVEPPGGAPGRLLAPFENNEVGAERSLYWWGYARGKRSIELDIDAERDTLLELVRRADFLIEADGPGALAARGLGYEDLRAINPALIYVSMSPYGGDGPKAAWASSDLTIIRRRRPATGTRGGSPGLASCCGRSGGRRDGRTARTRPLRSRSTRRRLCTAVRHARNSIRHRVGGRELHRRQPHHRGREGRRSRASSGA